MPVLGALDTVSPGSLLRIEVDVFGFAPTTAEVHSALSGVVNVVDVSRSLFGNYQITVRIDSPVRAGEIGAMVADTIRRGFVRVISADAVRYETLYSLPGSSGSTPVTTTISLVSLAVIGLAGVYLYSKLS
jgi:hypothetical protein